MYILVLLLCFSALQTIRMQTKYWLVLLAFAYLFPLMTPSLCVAAKYTNTDKYRGKTANMQERKH